MKCTLKIPMSFILLLLMIGCQSRKSIGNRFSSASDTIVIKTAKVKGSGLFQLGVSTIEFQDTSKTFSNPVKYPKNIKELKRFQLKTDFRSTDNHHVEIVKGIVKDRPIFIVDENNNKDLTDDSIRIYEPINWSKSAKLVKCEYLISDEKKIVVDSSWLAIGDSNGDFSVGRREYLVGNFEIDQKKYAVGIAEPRNPLSFTYGFRPEIAVLSSSGIQTESISETDLIAFGEALNLDGKYYRFEKISNTGDLLTLVKEQNFDQKIGTQIGMIAPSFSVVTMSGATIASSDLLDKPIVIANSCGCGGDEKSTQAFYDMEKAFGSRLHILHVDSNFKTTETGTHIDSEKDSNKEFYRKYRKEYCSRLCYVIGRNKRIVDKFDINDWKTSIPRLLD